MTPAEEVLDVVLTADWLASKNPAVDRLKVITGALYHARIDNMTHEEHAILLASEELAKMRALSRRLQSSVPLPDKALVIAALNAAEDMVQAVAYISGVQDLLAEAQRMTARGA